jgi:hypothetical protein
VSGKTPVVKKKPLDSAQLEALSKAELIQIILDQRKLFNVQLDEKEKRINELTEQLDKLKQERDEQKHKEINRHVNEPSSKKPVWDKDGKRRAYYWADKTRGSPVVERLLGEIFYGLLIVEGWHAYTKIVCAKQTCMAHIFRKIRAFIDAYPHYCSIN